MTRRVPADPRAVLVALERNYVDYVLIGGLARVLRGTDEVTHGADICPSFASSNLDRLDQAVTELDGRDGRKRAAPVTESALAVEPVIRLRTSAGELKIVGAPTGVPGGFLDLRRAATKEHLGEGLQPLVASTGDLARMVAALHRHQDLDRLRQLRTIMELEASRGVTLERPIEPARLAPSRTSSRTRKLTR